MQICAPPRSVESHYRKHSTLPTEFTGIQFISDEHFTVPTVHAVPEQRTDAYLFNLSHPDKFSDFTGHERAPTVIAADEVQSLFISKFIGLIGADEAPNL